MGKFILTEPLLMKKFIDKSVAEGKPEMVMVLRDMDRDNIEDMLGQDEAWMVMTKPWYAAYSKVTVDLMEKAGFGSSDEGTEAGAAESKNDKASQGS